ncbi:MAG: phosphotransferase [Clostridia bacterium]|nr:phosphotransferase [Clostridia bacterium]
MLKLEDLFEHFDLARLALTHYPHDPASLDAWLPRFRISSNAVYPFCDDGGLCFLRLCPEGEKPLAHIEGEIAFIRHLRDAGYPAMEPLPMTDGALCRTLHTPWGRWHVSAFRAVPGMPLEDAPLGGDTLMAYGASLARLHDLSAGQAFARPSYEETAAQMRPLLPQALHPVLDGVMADLAALPRTDETFGLVHYDFELDNIFLDPASGVISVIDFDDSLYHFYALDIAQALDSLADRFEGDALAGARSSFLRGYRSVRPFTAEQTLPLMRRFVDLRAVARLTHCLDSAPAARPQWLVQLEAKLTYKRGLLIASLQQGL